MREIAYFVSTIGIVIGGFWLAGHETPSQEILTSLILIAVSTIVVFASLKSLSSER